MSKAKRVEVKVRRLRKSLSGASWRTEYGCHAICASALRYFYDIPDDVREITLHASSVYVRGATRVEVEFDGGVTRLVRIDRARHRIRIYQTLYQWLTPRAWIWFEYDAKAKELKT